MKQMHLKHYVFINTINEVIKKNIAKFKKDKIIKRVGSPKDGYWEVVEKNL